MQPISDNKEVSYHKQNISSGEQNQKKEIDIPMPEKHNDDITTEKQQKYNQQENKQQPEKKDEDKRPADTEPKERSSQKPVYENTDNENGSEKISEDDEEWNENEEKDAKGKEDAQKKINKAFNDRGPDKNTSAENDTKR